MMRAALPVALWLAWCLVPAGLYFGPTLWQVAFDDEWYRPAYLDILSIKLETCA